jgi:hypothetical protein
VREREGLAGGAGSSVREREGSARATSRASRPANGPKGGDARARGRDEAAATWARLGPAGEGELFSFYFSF